jgi:phage tail tape-measure protein
MTSPDPYFRTLAITLQTLRRKGLLDDDDLRAIVAELEAEATMTEYDRPGTFTGTVNAFRRNLGFPK